MIWVTDWNLHVPEVFCLFACLFFFLMVQRIRVEFEWYRTKLKKVILLVMRIFRGESGKPTLEVCARRRVWLGREPELSLAVDISSYKSPSSCFFSSPSQSLSVKVKRLNWFLLLKVREGSPRKSLVKFRKNFQKGRIISHFLDRNMFNPFVCDRVEIGTWLWVNYFMKWEWEHDFIKSVQLRQIRV